MAFIVKAISCGGGNFSLVTARPARGSYFGSRYYGSGLLAIIYMGYWRDLIRARAGSRRMDGRVTFDYIQKDRAS